VPNPAVSASIVAASGTIPHPLAKSQNAFVQNCVVCCVVCVQPEASPTTDTGAVFGTSGVQRAIAWIGLLALSTGLAYGLNAAAARAVSVDLRAEDTTRESALYVAECRSDPACDANTRDPCALDADGALFALSRVWLPAGRSVPCRTPADPGLPTPEFMARPAGRIEATIVYVAPNQSRVVLYCLGATPTLPSQPRDISVEEIRNTYERICG